MQLFSIASTRLYTAHRDYLEHFSNPKTAQGFSLFRSNSRWIITEGRENGKEEIKKKKKKGQQ